MASKVPPTYDQFNRPEFPGLDFKDSPSMTKLEFAAECDLNVIMARYTQTGELPEGLVGSYGDFGDPLDFQAAQELIARSQQQFEGLPADVRARFLNDPVKLLEFVQDEKNFDEAHELGLLDADAVSARRAAQAAAAAAAAPQPGPGAVPAEAPPPSPAKPA